MKIAALLISLLVLSPMASASGDCVLCLKDLSPETPRVPALKKNPPAQAPVFPSLSMMIGENMGMKRPPRRPLPPLPPIPRPDSLPPDVLNLILDRMSNFSNFATVAYGASNIVNIQQSVMAQWMKEDARDDMNEYLSQLNETQESIARAAYKLGFAQIGDLNQILPPEVTLDWVNQYAATHGLRPSTRNTVY